LQKKLQNIEGATAIDVIFRAMKIIPTIVLFAMFGGAPKVYPVRVHIKQWSMHTTRGRRTGFVYSTRGHGFANVVEPGKGTQGFEFTFEDCDRPESPADGGGFPARWKNEHEMVIVNSEIGSDKTHECELKLTLRNVVYVTRNGHLATRPLGGPDDTDTSKDAAPDVDSQ